MSRKTQRDDVIGRMRAADPAAVAGLGEEIGDGDLEWAMARAIAVGESPSQPVPAGDRVAGEFAASGRSGGDGFFSRRRGTTLGLGAGLACVAAIAALILFAGGSVGGGGQPAFAAAAVKVAEANPRLLVTEPDWSVRSADQFETGQGEMTFSDGSHDLTVNWYPARYYGSYLRDRANVSTPVTSTLLGQTATTVDYGRDEYATMLSPRGEVFVEVRGQVGDRQAYEEVLDSLRAVDVETWLSAMPPSVVRPQERGAAIAGMLRGVPLPPGFDPAALAVENSVSSPYQLGAKVTGAVACGWLESWLAATEAGDGEAAQEAVDAMATSRSWPILRRLQTEGGWPSNIWHFAGELAHGRLNTGPSGLERLPDGREFQFGPAYAMALGCKGQYRRQVNR